MTDLTLGAYALYFILVAIKGNSGELLIQLKDDSGGFVPWAISVAILGMLYENEKTRPLAKPFILLAVITTLLKNFPAIKQNIIAAYNFSMQPQAQNTTANNTAVSNQNTNGYSASSIPVSGNTIPNSASNASNVNSILQSIFNTPSSTATASSATSATSSTAAYANATSQAAGIMNTASPYLAFLN